MSRMPVAWMVLCFVLGMIGAALGAWVLSRSARAQLEAQRQAFELAREQADRDLRQALLCAPQWVQQTVRVEMELGGRQQAERNKAQFREQQRWQAEQDERRLAEWRALLSPSAVRVAPQPPPVLRTDQPAPAYAPRRAPAPDPSARSVESTGTALPRPAPACAPEATERELSDEEIDALPPDLPAPARPQRRKLSAPKKPPLRNI